MLFGMTLQRAVETARSRSYDDGVLQIEDGVPAAGACATDGVTDSAG